MDGHENIFACADFSVSFIRTRKVISHNSFTNTPLSENIVQHFQLTGPGAHPASCTMGTGSFPGVKRPARGADHPPPPSAEVENEYSYTSAPPLVTFTFYFQLTE
jgi:hypothetical protein